MMVTARIDPDQFKKAIISFNCHDKELMTISNAGIRFRLDTFNGWTPDDFAKEFMNILECHTNVKFYTNEE